MVLKGFTGTPATIEGFYDIQVCDIECQKYLTRDSNATTCDNNRIVFNPVMNEFFVYDEKEKIYLPMKHDSFEGQVYIYRNPQIAKDNASNNSNNDTNNDDGNADSLHRYYCVNGANITKATVRPTFTGDHPHSYMKTTMYCPQGSVGFQGNCFKDSFIDEQVYMTCLHPNASNMDDCVALSNFKSTGYANFEMASFGGENYWCRDASFKMMYHATGDTQTRRCVPYSIFQPYYKPFSEQPCQTVYNKDCWLQPKPPPPPPAPVVVAASNNPNATSTSINQQQSQSQSQSQQQSGNR